MLLSYGDKHITIIFKFLRGDLSAKDFESWVYHNNALENILEESLYLQLISSDYNQPWAVHEVKQSLKKFLHKRIELVCTCWQRRDFCTLYMTVSETDEIINQYDKQKQRRLVINLASHDYRNIALYYCPRCQQHWLIAEEPIVYQVYCLARLSFKTAMKILQEDRWPSYFMTYEALLLLAKKECLRSEIYEYDNSDQEAYHIIIQRLIADRPQITLEEILHLLSLHQRKLRFELILTLPENLQHEIRLNTPKGNGIAPIIGVVDLDNHMLTIWSINSRNNEWHSHTKKEKWTDEDVPASIKKRWKGIIQAGENVLKISANTLEEITYVVSIGGYIQLCEKTLNAIKNSS